ncbi:MAG: hypothetical protein V1867_04095 [Candidatus Falkowbacteria bacterium]
MNFLFLAFILAIIILAMLIRKKKYIKDFSFTKEIRPDTKKITLAIMLFALSLLPPISGFPLKAYDFCLSLGFGGCGKDSSQILWLNFFLDLIFCYIFSCLIIFIFAASKK